MKDLPSEVRRFLSISFILCNPSKSLKLFELLNMTGIVFNGNKLFLVDLITSSDYEAFRPDTGFSTQDIVAVLLIVVMGALYWISQEDDLDWEALLGDDDDEE